MGKLFRLSLNDGVHLFRKMNAATKIDKRGQYDIMRCSSCGIEGMCRDLNTVEIKRWSKKAEFCDKPDKEIKKQKALDSYNEGVIINLKCPDCKRKLARIAEWTEENEQGIITNEVDAISVVCLCGFKAYLRCKRS